MKEDKLRTVLRDCPTIVPEFEIARVPGWLKDVYSTITKGSRLYMIEGSFRPKDWSGGGLNIGTSYVKFVGYTDISEWLTSKRLFVGTTLHKEA